MDNQNLQVAERVKEANNILVTVSANPSVDQLAACIGLTLSLNKMGKHATAVFSGQVPSTIEFLQPDKTLEKNTDSLRDFIISLDKSKADKLRYKVEDKVVKIFITPYKTSISEKDLDFSQGDFNVDVVLALGVHAQADLDQAITAHGRILHDATVVTLNSKPGGELGSINWLDPTASSLSELAVQLVDMLDKTLMDSQIATAMLTGIVAETDRFSNGKTSPRTMTISAELMTAGANQQLVATKLEQPVPPPVPAATPIAEATHDHEAPVEPVRKSNDGTLEISHEGERPAVPAPSPLPEPSLPPMADEPPAPAPKPEPELSVLPPLTPPSSASSDAAPSVLPTPFEPAAPESSPPQIHIDEHGSLNPVDLLPPVQTELPSISHHDAAPKMVLEPPTMGGQLTANTAADAYDTTPSVGMPVDESAPMGGEHSAEPAAPIGPTLMPPVDPAAEAAAPFLLGNDPGLSAVPTPPAAMPPAAGEGFSLPPIQPDDTLHDIEEAVHSSHLNTTPEVIAPAAPAASLTPPAPAPFSDPLPIVAPPAATAEPTLPPPPPVVLPPAPADAPSDPTVQSARDAVTQAINAAPVEAGALPPIAGLNAQPVDLPMGSAGLPGYPVGADPVAPAPPSTDPATPAWSPAAPPPAYADPQPALAPQVPGFGLPPAAQVEDPNAPPPVPPPMVPPSSPYSQPY